jgi:hypothetical protein
MRRFFVIAVIAGACGKSAGGEQRAWPEPPKDAIVKTTESGPVKATVAVWPPKPTLGDPIYLRLTVEAQAGVVLDVPSEDLAIQAGYRVADFDQQHDHAADGGEIEVRSLELEAPSSGRRRIPPLRLEFTDGRAASGSGSGSGKLELLTDEIPIEIGAVSTDRTGAELKPARGAIDPVVGRKSPWPWIAGGGSALLVFIASLFVVRATRRRRAAFARASAYDTAMAALAALEARGAPGADDADAWFVELSAIVRRYLEGRFGVRAPELTTEEFLQEARRSRDLDDAHRERLGEFLAACDRVKFAGWRPTAEESLATLGAARAFVDETRLVPTQIPEARAA